MSKKQNCRSKTVLQLRPEPLSLRKYSLKTLNAVFVARLVFRLIDFVIAFSY